VDALSDVLRAVRLTGAVFFDIRVSSPWVAETPDGGEILTRLFPGSDHLIPYHVVTEGTCWGRVLDGPATKLETGDIIMFPRGGAHVMSSAPGMRGRPNLSLYRWPEDGQLPFSLAIGDSGRDPGRVVCGYLACDGRPFNPLLAALPPVIHVRAMAGDPLDAFVRFAVNESKAPRVGGESALTRLSELLFIEVVRRYLETLPEEQTGWLAGLKDPHVGRALTALHQHPARDWTLEDLAREVGMSRSALAERFAALVGEPAMQYLTNWRMQLAARDLISSTDGLAEIAERVGYGSEATFSRAFKKVVGMAPGQWRRHRDGAITRSSRTPVGTRRGQPVDP